MLAVATAAVLAGANIVQNSDREVARAPAVTGADLISIAPTSACQRADDGLFYVTGLVNGTPVKFLIDTGASSVVLTREDAVRAGVLSADAAFVAHADTANGEARVAWTTIGQLQVGDVLSHQVSAAITPGGLAVSLLGQSWLSQLGSVTIVGDRMLLGN